MKSLITLTNVSKTFMEEGKHVEAVHEVNLDIRAGEFLMLLGPSGSGKSTLLRLLADLIPPTHGKIEYAQDLQQAMIFQNFALFPWLTVSGNIEFGLKMSGMPEAARSHLVKQEIKKMGLTEFEHSFPHELSGGMKQRVGIARALAVQPQLLLLDEPFSALDSFTAKKLRQELVDIWTKQKLTIVMVTHLIEEALLMADRIIVLTARPAEVAEIIYNPLPRPRDVRSTKFFELADRIERIIKV